MGSLHAFNFRQWIDANRALLKPPVGNKRVFRDGEFIIMVVGGPNARKDYHVDPGEEFFYQLEGDMVLKTMQDGRAVDLPIREGEILLLPAAAAALAAAGRQHRGAGRSSARGGPASWTASSGIASAAVSACTRNSSTLTDIEKQFPPVFERFFAEPEEAHLQPLRRGDGAQLRCTYALLVGGREIRVDMSQPVDLAVPLDFTGRSRVTSAPRRRARTPSRSQASPAPWPAVRAATARSSR